MPELPPYVPEFDLAFMSQMLGVGAVRSRSQKTQATGDDETIMQEAAVDIADIRQIRDILTSSSSLLRPHYAS